MIPPDRAIRLRLALSLRLGGGGAAPTHCGPRFPEPKSGASVAETAQFPAQTQRGVEREQAERHANTLASDRPSRTDVGSKPWNRSVQSRLVWHSAQELSLAKRRLASAGYCRPQQVFELRDDKFELRDSDGDTITARRRLLTQLTLRDGRIWYERPAE
jgi:hypothetical protein